MRTVVGVIVGVEREGVMLKSPKRESTSNMSVEEDASDDAAASGTGAGEGSEGAGFWTGIIHTLAALSFRFPKV